MRARYMHRQFDVKGESSVDTARGDYTQPWKIEPFNKDNIDLYDLYLEYDAGLGSDQLIHILFRSRHPRPAGHKPFLAVAVHCQLTVLNPDQFQPAEGLSPKSCVCRSILAA